MKTLPKKIHVKAHSDRLDSGRENVLVQPGDLDGFTIMRYAHVYRGRTSGGVEQYLRQLNRGLPERHGLTVLQTYLANDAYGRIEIEAVGMA